MLVFVAEESKKQQDERDAWRFLVTSLNEPLGDVDYLPPALASQKAAYSALSPEQKVHLSTVLLPLLLARKNELTADGGKIDGLGTFDANSWLRVMCALANRRRPPQGSNGLLHVNSFCHQSAHKASLDQNVIDLEHS